jgi:hypothetical protein
MTDIPEQTQEYFLSYSRADEEIALRFADDLIAAGVCVWVDQYDIRASQHWDRAIEEAVRRCGGLLVILSPRSARSVNVADEVAMAIDASKCVIPILIEKCAVPLRMTRLQLIDATSDYDHALRKCLDEIARSCLPSPASRTADASDGAARPSPVPAPRAAGPAMSPHESQRLCEDLAKFLGPIAPHVVRREAASASSIEHLRARLAEHIPNEDERRKFLG